MVADEGGRTLFVSVTAPGDVLEARVAADARRAHGKLVDVDRLREMLASHDLSPLHDDDLVIDTGARPPDEAAEQSSPRSERAVRRSTPNPSPPSAAPAGSRR